MPRDSFEAKLGLDGGPFLQTIRKIDGRLDRFEKQSKRRFASLGKSIDFAKKALIGFIGFQALRGFASFGKQIVDADARLFDLSKRLGVSTEFLSGYGFAAEQSGIRLNDFILAVQRAARRVNEFRITGGGEAAFSIQQLGLESAVASARNFEELLPVILERLNQVEDAGKRLPLAFKFFDSEGVSILQLATRGRAEIEQLIEEGRARGQVLSTQQAQIQKELSQELGKLSATWKGFTQTLVREFSPSIRGAVKAVDDFLNSDRLARLERVNRLAESSDRANRQIAQDSVLGDVLDFAGSSDPRAAESRRQRELADRLNAQQAVVGSLRGFANEISETQQALRERVQGFRILEGGRGLANAANAGVRRLQGLERDARRRGVGFDFDTSASRSSDFSPSNNTGFNVLPKSNLEAGLEAGADDVRQAASTFNVVRDRTVDLARTMSGTLTSAFDDIKRGTFSVRDTAIQFLDTVSSSIFSGIADRAVGSLFGSFLGGATGSMQGRVITGPRSGFPTLIPLNLHGRERVHVEPVQGRGRSGSSSPTVIVVHSNGGESQALAAVEAALSDREPEIAARIVDEIRRSGSLQRQIA